MQKLMLGVLALMALGTFACARYSTAVVSTGGKAYVTGAGFLNQTMYLCDASSGKPVCKQLEEQ
jgi:hypothetical protein